MSNTANACAGTGQQGAYAYGTPNGHVVCPSCGRIVKAYPGGKVRSHKPAEVPVTVDVHSITIGMKVEMHADKDRTGYAAVCSCGWIGATLFTRAGGVQPAKRAEHWGERHVRDAAKAAAAEQPEAVSA